MLLKTLYCRINSVLVLLDEATLDQILNGLLDVIVVLLSLLEGADLLFHHLESVKLFLERFLTSYLSCLFIPRSCFITLLISAKFEVILCWPYNIFFREAAESMNSFCLFISLTTDTIYFRLYMFAFYFSCSSANILGLSLAFLT